MTITDAMIEAAARALCLHANLKPDFKVPADVYGMDGEDENGAGWRYQWRMFAERTKLALEAAERAAWRPEGECDKTDGTEYLAKDGSIVFWHDGKANYWEAAGWYDIRDGLFTAKPKRVDELRPLPTPGGQV